MDLVLYFYRNDLLNRKKTTQILLVYIIYTQLTKNPINKTAKYIKKSSCIIFFNLVKKIMLYQFFRFCQFFYFKYRFGSINLIIISITLIDSIIHTIK